MEGDDVWAGFEGEVLEEFITELPGVFAHASEPVNACEHEPTEFNSDTSSSSDSSDSDEVDVEFAQIKFDNTPTAAKPRMPAKFSSTRLYVHTVWKTVHKAHSTEVGKLACGRKVHAGFVLMPPACPLIRPNCTGCFGLQP